MRSALTVLAASSFFVGCTDRELGVTERDAVDLGFELVDCGRPVADRIYVMPDSAIDTARYCEAISQARREVMGAAMVSEAGLSTDSITVIAAWTGRYSRTPGQVDGSDFFFDITFDLKSSRDNVRVVLNRPAGEPEVSWAPEGLRY